ncbi:hypothetical protein P3339_18650 [Microbulbifer sp. MLAF003]|uniref:hypothetical protein n=1 Tax=Microbulbifer sp. MLAF003 TaxID=3032582 RepID=UPI0024ACA8B0|nr:hypothetical protein [Microbulbifer sp. MLAF003]WHI50439.1 hypothetical protein P3339_18650 [Microbulbifer sp. MLAF003]
MSQKITGNLGEINITSKEVLLEGSFPAGLSETGLRSKYPNLKLSCEDGAYKEFEYPNKEIEFWLKGGIVSLDTSLVKN